MTMIELVAALALFVVILGSLLTVMDTATSLWSSSRSQQREQTTAENIAALVFDDLYEAVADNGVPTNSASAPVQPTFILSSPPSNDAPNQVVTVLAFARHASPRTYSEGNNARRLSLDAVFYTFYNNALFRHVIPLSYTSFDDPETLGELLENQRANVEKPALHDTILAAVKNPTAEVLASWSCLLLAERVELGLLATLPGNHVLNTSYSQEPVTLSELETAILPDRLDLAFCVYNEEDWATCQSLKNDTSDDATRRKQHLGVLYSKRISFPAKGGSRLP